MKRMRDGEECMKWNEGREKAETRVEWGKRGIALKGVTQVHELIGTRSKTFLSMLYRKRETRMG